MFHNILPHFFFLFSWNVVSCKASIPVLCNFAGKKVLLWSTRELSSRIFVVFSPFYGILIKRDEVVTITNLCVNGKIYLLHDNGEEAENVHFLKQISRWKLDSSRNTSVSPCERLE